MNNPIEKFKRRNKRRKNIQIEKRKTSKGSSLPLLCFYAIRRRDAMQSTFWLLGISLRNKIASIFFFIVGCKANWYNLSNCLFLPFSRAVFSACSRICVSSNFEISACDTRGRSSNSSSLSAFRVSMLKGSCDGKGESTGLIMPVVVITEGTGGSWISANGLVLDGRDKLKGKFKKEDEEKVVEVDDEDEDEEEEDKRLLLVKKDDESEAKEAEMEGTDELDDEDDDAGAWFWSAFCWDWSWDWSWEVIWLVIANWACR